LTAPRAGGAERAPGWKSGRGDATGSEAPARLAWIYPLAWLPYFAAYGLALAYVSEVQLGIALFGAFANTLPPALLGIVVLRLTGVVPQQEVSLRGWLLSHAAGAILFAVASAGCTWLIFLVESRLTTGVWGITPNPGPLVWQVFLGLVVYGVLVSTATGLRLFLQVRDQRARLERARALQVDAELRALRARLNPHFLFNCLHTVRELVRSDADAAERAIERLGSLLRTVLDDEAVDDWALEDGALEGDRPDGAAQEGSTAEHTTVEREWRFVSDYLALEALRLGQRLRLEQRVDPAARRCLLPRFTLQPLVENAIRHAVAPRVGGGRLRIEIWLEGEQESPDRPTGPAARLHLRVCDDGPGIDREESPWRPGRGLALVRERLELLYGERASLSLVSGPERPVGSEDSMGAEGGAGSERTVGAVGAESAAASVGCEVHVILPARRSREVGARSDELGRASGEGS